MNEDDKITIKLRPSFAVYFLSSLSVIHDKLDETTDGEDTANVKARVASLEVMCFLLANALDEQKSRSEIDEITENLINRYK